MNDRYNIVCRDDVASHASSDLRSVLERLLPVRFVRDEQARGEIGGEISVERSTGADGSLPHSTLRLSVSDAMSIDSTEVREYETEFADDKDVPFPFRNRTVRANVGPLGEPLSLLPGEKVLAKGKDGPLWTMSETGGVRHFRSALPLPRI